MTLENFITWTEMNDGLTAPAQVKELITVMQKEKDTDVKNFSDVTRQWSTVASAIAATENQDCLRLFIQLDGLWYLNSWLKDAANFWNDTSGSAIEDTITNLLQAVKRLQVDNDKLISSGVHTTVKDLLGHNSSKVQDKAKALFNSWNEEKESDAADLRVEKIGTLGEGKGVTAEHLGSGSSESSNKDTNASRGSLTVDKQDKESKDMPSTGFETLKAEVIKSGTSDDAITNSEVSNSANSSSLSNPASENLHISSEPPRCCPESAALTESSMSAGPNQVTKEEEMHAPELDSTDDVKLMRKIENSPKKLDKVDVPKSTFSTDDTDASESATEPGLMKSSNATEKDSSSKAFSSAGLRTAVSEAKSRIDDDISSGNCRSSLVFRRKDDGNCNSDVLQDSNIVEQKVETFKESGVLSQRIENGGPVERVDEDNSDRSEGGLPKDYDFPKPRMLRKDYALNKKSDLDLDYGIVDPLEVARQVAIEVEREVEDCQERSCSSSEKEFNKAQLPQSPHSVGGKQFQTDQSSPVEMPTRADPSSDSPTREEPTTSAGNLEAEQLNGTQDGESSQVTEAAQEVEANPRKGLSYFDLNEEVYSEDTEHQGDIMSPPVSVVSASRAAAAAGMPAAPLQFEGALGWKGSAATSAFRAASHRRVPENDSSLSAGGSNGSSKQNRGFLNIDLNVAEGGDDRITDMQSGKENVVSSRLASGESSVEESPRRLEKLELDLNRISDDGDAPPDCQPKGDLLHQRNGHHSQSPSSSSSSKQPSLRNIDLNDQPIFVNDTSSNYYQKSSQNLSASGGMRSDGSVISIMGMRVEVNRGNSTAQNLPLPNGRTPEPATDNNFARSGGVFGMGPPAFYSHPPVYGYNSLAAGPALPFPSTVYGPGGPIPYMVDSRAPVVPQIMGSSSALPPAFGQPPFVFSMTGTPSSSGIRPVRNSLDLNSGLILEGGNRDLGGFRQLFNPAQTSPVDELFRSNSQPSTSSGINGKRKEPDGGWEPYRLKHH